jgi:hypothetical protein
MRKHYKLKRRNIFLRNRPRRSVDWFASALLAFLGCVSLIFIYNSRTGEQNAPAANTHHAALQDTHDRGTPEESIALPKVEPESQPPAAPPAPQPLASGPSKGTDLNPNAGIPPDETLDRDKGRTVDRNSVVASSETTAQAHNGHSAAIDHEGPYPIGDAPAGNDIVRAAGEDDAPQATKVAANIADPKDADPLLPKPEKMVFCKDIQKDISDTGVHYTLFGIDTEFPDETDRVICFTKIIGAQDDTVIAHRWFWEDKLQSQVFLEIKSRSWRTYSSKTILPSQRGTWRVDVTEPYTETLLASSTFVVR